jgi:hypothetical protein
MTWTLTNEPPAAFHVCAKRDSEEGMINRYEPRKAQRRQQCSTALKTFSTAKRGAARSVSDSLVSFGTTPGERRFVQRSALVASKPAGRPTANGYARPPEHNCSASCCNDADCYPTEIEYIDGSIYAKRREDGKYLLVPPEKVERNRDNPDGRNHLCAPPPNALHPSDTVYCFALGGAT